MTQIKKIDFFTLSFGFVSSIFIVYFLKEGVHYPKADEGDEGYDNHSIWNIDKSYNIEILKRTYSFMKRHKKHFIYIIEEKILV